MIDRITGKVIEKNNGAIILLCNGIGFEINATTQALTAYEIGKEITINTSMCVKEDSISLYGFSSAEEKQMFLNLISITGIGPKMAIAIISGSSAEELALSIVSGNVQVLSRIKGVGKKTAERIVLELKEKMTESINNTKIEEKAVNNKMWQEAEDAIFGLRSLGIKEVEAIKLVERIAEKGMSAEEIITQSLKGLAKK